MQVAHVGGAGAHTARRQRRMGQRGVARRAAGLPVARDRGPGAVQGLRHGGLHGIGFLRGLQQAGQRLGVVGGAFASGGDQRLGDGLDGGSVHGLRKVWAKPGIEALQELHAAMQARGASECQYVTLGTLSDNAQRFARAHQVKLVQPEAVVLLLRHWPATATP